MVRDCLRTLIGAVCLILIVCSGTSCKKPEQGVPAVSTEDAAPDFTLDNVQGGRTTLSQLRGKVVLLEFWTTWCPPCRESVPELNALYAKYRERGLVILAVSMDVGSGAKENVQLFVKEHAVTYPVLLDDGEANRNYNISNIPALFLIDKNGKISKRYVGFVPGLAESIGTEIEALL
jgi:peroxiredoxin